MQCWADNFYGELGNPTAGAYSTTPVSETNLSSGVAAISANSSNACALRVPGRCCVGRINEVAELSNGAYTKKGAHPTRVAIRPKSAPAAISGRAGIRRKLMIFQKFCNSSYTCKLFASLW